MDERRGAGLRKCFGDDVEESCAFDLAMRPEAGGDAVKVGIVIAGVADELPIAIRKMVEETAESERVELAGDGDAQGAIAGSDDVVLQIGVRHEGSLESVEHAELEAAKERSAVPRASPAWLERIANSRNGDEPCCLKQGTMDCGEDVSVLMCIKMSYSYAGALELPDLRESFGANIFRAQSTQERSGGEGGEGRAEAGAIEAKERRDRLWGRDGDAVGEDDVAADAERGVPARDGEGVIKCGSASHQRRRAEDAGTMQLFDRAVDSRSEPKIVRIDDQSSGHDY